MPNPPKPNEVKRRMGNPGKKPLPKLEHVVPLPMALEPPKPPRPLGVEGFKLWVRVWEGGKTWISPASDLEHVLLLCETLDERTALREQVFAGAEWRDRVALRALDHQISSMLASIGFNPVERSRLGFAEVKAMSKLDELIARRAEKGR